LLDGLFVVADLPMVGPGVFWDTVSFARILTVDSQLSGAGVPGVFVEPAGGTSVPGFVTVGGVSGPCVVVWGAVPEFGLFTVASQLFSDSVLGRSFVGCSVVGGGGEVGSGNGPFDVVDGTFGVPLPVNNETIVPRSPPPSAIGSHGIDGVEFGTVLATLEGCAVGSSLVVVVGPFPEVAVEVTGVLAGVFAVCVGVVAGTFSATVGEVVAGVFGAVPVLVEVPSSGLFDATDVAGC
jgi:hypothetical protein